MVTSILPEMSINTVFSVSSFLILCAAGLGLFLRKFPVNTVRGPPNPSWLLGKVFRHLRGKSGQPPLGHHTLLRYAKAGELEQRWAKEYGLTYRLAGVFSVSTTVYVQFFSPQEH